MIFQHLLELTHREGSLQRSNRRIRNFQNSKTMSVDKDVEDSPTDSMPEEVDGEPVWCCAESEDSVDSAAIPETNGVNHDNEQKENCWVSAVIACVLQNEKIFWKVVPKDKIPTAEDNNHSKFIMQLWRYGKWMTKSLDSWLPVPKGKLVFAHCQRCIEFWKVMLEKGFTEFHGIRATMKGYVADAMTGFTGGMVEYRDLSNHEDNFQDMIDFLKAKSRELLAVACTDKKSGRFLANNLANNHAYSILRVEEVEHNGENVVLFRMLDARNPALEWKGAWNYSSNKWDEVTNSEDVKQNFGYYERDKGHFCMDFDEFKKTFKTVEMCHLIEEGNEIKELGEPLNQLDLQFDNEASVMVEIMQYAEEPLGIAFDLYEQSTEKPMQDTRGIPQMQPVQGLTAFRRFQVGAGAYSVVVSTDSMETEVLVRVANHNSLIRVHKVTAWPT